MGQGDIRAGGAYVELFVKGNVGPQLNLVQKKLQQLGENITSIGKRLAGIGAGITAPLLLAAQRFASMGDEINKASQRTGIGVEQLGALKYAAEQSGASFEDLESGVKKMEKTLFEAEAGSAAANQALRDLGLTAAGLKGQSPDQQLLAIGDALSHVQDAGARAAIAMQIFGKGGTQLLPLFADGAEGMRKLTDRARELGLVFSKEDAEAATRFRDICEDLWKQVQAVAFQVGAAVAQALQPFAEAATRVLSSIIEWIKENRALVIAILGAGIALIAAGTALIAFGTAISVTGAAIEGLLDGLAFTKSALLLLTNPIVLIGVGLVALAGYFLFFTETGGKALAWLSGKFDELKSDATETFGGIADALAAGDITLAAQLFWTFLKLEWTRGVEAIKGIWAPLVIWWNDTIFGMQSTFALIGAGIETIWASLVYGMGTIFDGFVHYSTLGILKLLDTFQGPVLKLLGISAKLLGLGKDFADFQKTLAQSSPQQLIALENQRYAGDTSNSDDYQKRLDGVHAELDKTLAELADAHKKANDKTKDDSADEIAKLEKRKAELQAQLAALREKAHVEKDHALITNLPPKPNFDNDPFAAAGAGAAAKSAGIFNSAAILALQSSGQSTQDQIRQNTLDSANSLKKIERTKINFQFGP
jgi:TP901 family phage tail tape measure protein